MVKGLGVKCDVDVKQFCPLGIEGPLCPAVSFLWFVHQRNTERKSTIGNWRQQNEMELELLCRLEGACHYAFASKLHAFKCGDVLRFLHVTFHPTKDTYTLAFMTLLC